LRVRPGRRVWKKLVDLDGGRGLADVEDAALGDLLAAGGRDAQVDVAVGRARQRRDPERGARAGAQRDDRLVLDVEGELGLAVVAELDLGDRADAATRDLDEVALDDVRRRLEARLDGVALVSAQEQPATTTMASSNAATAAIRPIQLVRSFSVSSIRSPR
jgi:hypothetical protein